MVVGVWRCSGANREAGCARIKVERWELPGGKVAFEVSRNGKDGPADLEEFLSQVVRPLLVAGANLWRTVRPNWGVRAERLARSPELALVPAQERRGYA